MRITSIALIAASFVAIGLSPTDVQARHRRRCCNDWGWGGGWGGGYQTGFYGGGGCCDGGYAWGGGYSSGYAFSSPSYSYSQPAMTYSSQTYAQPMQHSAAYGPTFTTASNCQPNYSNWNQPQPYGTTAAPPAPQTFAPDQNGQFNPNAPANQNAPASNQNPPAPPRADANADASISAPAADVDASADADASATPPAANP
jgi:hypothetical protein